ncbi:MAG: hypothetical protein ACRDI0_12545 [Actinomycetota bacterium]
MRIRAAIPAFTVLLVVALGAAGCSSGSPGAADRSAGAGRPKAPKAVEATEGHQPSEATVPDVLDFTAPAVGGGNVSGAEFAGRDVAMWFWAPT